MTDIAKISEIWNIILQSNTFNFVLFVLILAWVFKKINMASIIESLQQKIIKLIDEAKKNHEDAKTALLNAKKAVANLDTEIKVIVEDANKSATVIGEKIMTEAQKQLENIETNAEKIIEAEEKMLVAQLTKSASKASVEAAKSNIQNTLAQTPSLHEKYIDDSINELDRLNF